MHSEVINSLNKSVINSDNRVTSKQLELLSRTKLHREIHPLVLVEVFVKLLRQMLLHHWREGDCRKKTKSLHVGFITGLKYEITASLSSLHQGPSYLIYRKLLL